MNKKQRKKVLDKLAFLDSGIDYSILQLIENDPALQAITDPKEYAHQVFQKMLAALNEKMKKMY
jgi:hypothetical protein